MKIFSLKVMIVVGVLCYAPSLLTISPAYADALATIKLQEYIASLTAYANNEDRLIQPKNVATSSKEYMEYLACDQFELGNTEVASKILASISNSIANSISTDYEKEKYASQSKIISRLSIEATVSYSEFNESFLQDVSPFFCGRTKQIVRLLQYNFLSSYDKYFTVAVILGRRKDIAGQRLFLLNIPEVPGINAASAALALSLAGNLYFEEKDQSAANDCWKRVYDAYPNTSSWPMATYNMGILQKERLNYDAAIGYFSEVIEKYPNEVTKSKWLMDPYMTYSHRAALEISYCYETSYSYLRALHYSIYALFKFKGRSSCANCAMSETFSLVERIISLLFRVFLFWVILPIALYSAYIRVKQRLFSKDFPI